MLICNKMDQNKNNKEKSKSEIGKNCNQLIFN